MTNQDFPDEYNNLHNARILVVEDNEINQELIVDLLEQFGVSTTVASNGKEALHLLTGNQFDGVLMDCQMPVLDGYSATRAIRRMPHLENLPIIAVTANAMDGDREKAISAGMNDHIAKPVNLKNLLDILTKWLNPDHQAPTELASDPVIFNDDITNLQAIPGIDLAQGFALFSGRIDAYKRTLIMFREQYRDIETDFENLKPAEDNTELQRLAHSIKGSAANLGLTSVAHAAGKLELDCKESAARIDLAMQELVDDLKTVIKALNAIS